MDTLYSTPIAPSLRFCDAQVPTLSPDLEGRSKVKAWVSKLHSLPASYELSEPEARQLLFELEGSYNEFMAHLQR